jgi:hypothetical protein
MSPQNVLSVRSLSSVSVVILIWRLCQNIISIASSNLQNYGIETCCTKLLCMADKRKISRPTWTVCWLHAWSTRIDNPKIEILKRKEIYT